MTFKDLRLEKLWDHPADHSTLSIPKPLLKVLFRKLQMLDAACDLRDLLAPPGNRLEKLKGDRSGQFSIRVNDRWRLCFIWKHGEAREVELVDYH